jgi:hypothetical protein
MGKPQTKDNAKGRGSSMGTTRQNVETRAEGRPPEEAASENPEEQAEAILEESEDRVQQGADRSEANEA